MIAVHVQEHIIAKKGEWQISAATNSEQGTLVSQYNLKLENNNCDNLSPIKLQDEDFYLSQVG